MNAIEFKTTISAEGIIQLPEKYKNFSRSQVKVIILKEEEVSTRDQVADQYAKLKAVIDEIQD